MRGRSTGIPDALYRPVDWWCGAAPRDTPAQIVSPPVIYYVRHGLTDWNVDSNGCRAGTTCRSTQQGCAQAVRCAGDPARSVPPRRPGAGEPRLRVESARARAQDHGDRARDAWPRARRLRRRRAACRNRVRRMGRPDLCRRAGARRGRHCQARIRQMGFSAARRRKLCAGDRSNTRNGTRRSTATRWSPPMAAPRARSSRISRSRRRRMPRIIPSIRAWSTSSRATGSRATRDGCRRQQVGGQ